MEKTAKVSVIKFIIGGDRDVFYATTNREIAQWLNNNGPLPQQVIALLLDDPAALQNALPNGAIETAADVQAALNALGSLPTYQLDRISEIDWSEELSNEEIPAWSEKELYEWLKNNAYELDEFAELTIV